MGSASAIYSVRLLLLTLVFCVACVSMQAVAEEALPAVRLSIIPKAIEPVTSLNERQRRVKQEAQDKGGSSTGIYIPFGIHFGTMGWGGFVGFGFTPFLSTRFVISKFDYKTTQNIQFGTGATPGDITLELGYQALIIDYHPFGGSFYVSAGFVNNNTNVALDAAIDQSESFSFGGETFRFDDSGTLHATLTPKSKRGFYYGIGFGNYGGGSPFTFALDLGIISQGDFEATVTHSGFTTQQARTELDEQAQASEDRLNNSDDLSFLKQYPVLQMYFAYRFDF